MNEYNENNMNSSYSGNGFNSSAPEDVSYRFSGNNIPNGQYSSQFNYQSYAQPHDPEKQEKNNKRVSGKKTVAIALACAILGGIAGGGAVALIGRGSSDGVSKSNDYTTVYESERQLAPVNTVSVKDGTLLTASQLYQMNVASTVGIKTEVTTNYWGFTSTSAASGSGFIISDDGYVITNYHVIENANSVSVNTYDGNTYEATIIGYDSSNDIAVLKIEADGLVPVVLGSSDNTVVGEDVVAIGNPLGELTFSLTKGTVSALNRTITIDSERRMSLIQTDCAINSGNSGGALFNMYGEVIGITNAKYSSSSSGASVDNIGFAIPIDSVKSIIESIIEKGYVSKPYIGVSVETVSADAVAYGTPEGAAIKKVVEGGAAEKAGLKLNDVIVAIDGVEIKSSDDAVTQIQAKEIGAKSVFKIYRQGETLEITVTIGEKISTAEDNSSSGEQQQQQSEQQYTDPYGQQGSIFPWGFGFGF